MPITVELQPEQHWIDVVATGTLTQPERLAALARCIELLGEHLGAGVLFDGRAALSAPTAPETRQIIEVVGSVVPVFRAGVAFVLAEGVQYGMARMLQALLEGRGVTVSVFTDLESAHAWLGTRV